MLRVDLQILVAVAVTKFCEEPEDYKKTGSVLVHYLWSSQAVCIMVSNRHLFLNPVAWSAASPRAHLNMY